MDEECGQGAPPMNLFDPLAFGQYVRAKLERDGTSVRDAAPVVPCSPATLNRVARGNAPDVENYFRITRWLRGASAPEPINQTWGDIIAAGATAMRSAGMDRYPEDYAEAVLAALLENLKTPSFEMKMAGATAITAEAMRSMANYDAMPDCWDAMIEHLLAPHRVRRDPSKPPPPQGAREHEAKHKQNSGMVDPDCPGSVRLVAGHSRRWWQVWKPKWIAKDPQWFRIAPGESAIKVNRIGGRP